MLIQDLVLDPASVLLALVPYYPFVPIVLVCFLDCDAFGSDSLLKFRQTSPDAFPLQPPVSLPFPGNYE